MLLNPLLQALNIGGTILTPTNRLQREILWNFAQIQTDSVLVKPACYSYDAFLKHWFAELTFQYPESCKKTLLSPEQFALLWKKIADRPLNDFELSQAIAAYKNCALALSPPSGSDFLYTPAADFFQKMYLAIEAELAENAWIAPMKLADELMKHPYPLSTPSMTWAFFDCLHPQQEKLQHYCKTHHIEQIFFDYPPSPQSDQHFIYEAKDETDEFSQMIAWVQHAHQQGKKRIGIVVPDLRQNATYLQKKLTIHLPPDNLHFSLGHPLDQFPMVKHALCLLSIDTQKNLNKEQCKIILLSALVQGNQNGHELLQHPIFQEPEIPYFTFVKLFQNKIKALQAIQDYPSKAKTADWINWFAKRLSQFDFPASAQLSEEGVQLLNKFYGCIEEFQAAASIQSEMSAKDALIFLEKICSEKIHQPPQNYHGIHVMGWLEASGFCGDALWICHFQSHLVPDNTSLSPLLPIHWQKEHHLARTNRAKEFEMGQRMLNRFIDAHAKAPLIISYAQKIAQEPLWPSPLLPNWPNFSPQTPIIQSLTLESYQQNYFLPYLHQTFPKGGYQVLASLAKCPFQAFANYRLKTKQTLSEELGFNASEKGRVIHRVLQYIWQDLKEQAQLLSKTHEEINQLCLKAIEQTLQEFATNRPYSMDSLLLDLEKQQLLETIQAVLAFDKQRPPFKIKGLEESLNLDIDGWSFKLRYDRLDELDNGELLMIDYKSNLPTPLPWYDERPIHPQILMYALADRNIRYLLFLGIKIQDFKASGFGAQDIQLPQLKVCKDEWLQMQQQWLLTLQTLITEFKSGVCTPDPISSQSCNFCHNRDLCRQQI